MGLRELRGETKVLHESRQVVVFICGRPFVGDRGFPRVPDLQRQFHQVRRWERDQTRFERTQLRRSRVRLECPFHVGGTGFRGGRAHLVGGEERSGHDRGPRFLNLASGAWV